MSSDESDDEPLSVIAAAKKLNPEKYDFPDPSAIEVVPVRKKKKKKKKLLPENLSITIKLSKSKANDIKIVERPADVWLYMKDLNPSGPYSCLLCPYWFINRAKLIIHYVLNHKKDFCGICRYFVASRENWIKHEEFHTPYPCSQCTESYPTEAEMRRHLSDAHNLVHCRLCHFRTTDDEQYDNHLFQKHNVTNVASKRSELLWDIEFDGCPKFLCLLCSKGNNLTTAFFSHYMGYHHFTLKCITQIISGNDPPFTVEGANISSNFIEGQLKNEKIGYIDMEKKAEPVVQDTVETKIVVVPEIKHEIMSDNEEEMDADVNTTNKDDTLSYKGEEDFDVTLVELIVLQKYYFDYVNTILSYINSNILAGESVLDYKTLKRDSGVDVVCSLCKTKVNSVQTYITHMAKIHTVKSVPLYSCRICATSFESRSEFENHVLEEMNEFEDLWLCQFCDQEFDNREHTRKHLNEHWDLMEFDNCFSPHLGFKCRYCPTLFWNETDRETHQVRVHFNNHKNQFYRCQNCSETFSDKIWFIHHYIDRHQVGVTINDVIFLYKCHLCSLVLNTMEDMRTHFGSEHPESRKIFCTLGSCLYRPLSQRKSFKLHVKSFHTAEGRNGPGENSTSCPMCGREFGSARACGAHMSQAHGTGKFKCKLCKDVMHTMDERKLHYLIRHPGRHPFECTECGKSFQYKSSLYMHKQEHAPNKQPLTCSFCGKVFMKKDSFREHMQIHEGPRHACSYCPMRFVQRSNMLRHERRHTGERPYACPQCPRTFADKGACTSHLRTHSKDRSYACIYCGQTFVQKSKLTYHIRKHTGENLETCPVCSKLFTSACSLREHMRIHERSSLEAVQCPLCDRKYQNGRYMLRHLRTLHNQERFSCPLCRKSLTSVAGLRHHVVTHGRANMYQVAGCSSTVQTDRYMLRHLRNLHNQERFSCPLCRKSLTSVAGLRHHVVTHGRANMYQCKVCPKSYAVRRTLMKHLRKRHNIKSTDLNLKEYFQRRDPRDCDLPLDEDSINKIFGPRQKKNNDILIGDFVTFTKSLNMAAADQRDANDDDERESGESEGEGTSEYQEGELEPTDFVSVKIEHVEEDEYDED